MPFRRRAVAEIEPRGREDVGDQALELVEVAGDVRQHLARDVGVAFEREIEGHASAGERGAQLVRDVGEELALGAEQRGQALGHLVEGAGDLAELVAALRPDARREIAAAEARAVAERRRSGRVSVRARSQDETPTTMRTSGTMREPMEGGCGNPGTTSSTLPALPSGTSPPPSSTAARAGGPAPAGPGARRRSAGHQEACWTRGPRRSRR